MALRVWGRSAMSRMTQLRKSDSQLDREEPPHRKIAVNGNSAYMLEFCVCGKHPRIMPAWVLLASWRQGRRAMTQLRKSDSQLDAPYRGQYRWAWNKHQEETTHALCSPMCFPDIAQKVAELVNGKVRP
jgi:hypothetical protein